MIHLQIWLTTPSGKQVHAGDIAVADPDARGRLRGQFRYDPHHISQADAFPLDPVSLPLKRDVPFDAEEPRSGLHGVFRDALPDDWGRRLLAKRYRLTQHQLRPANLLALLGPRVLGALRFTEDSTVPVPAEGGVRIERLDALMHAARRFDQPDSTVAGIDDDEAMALLFRAGSSAGGARPKALVSDGAREYIAKFPAGGDRYAMVPLEAATLELARRSGLNVPANRVENIDGESALLVERFDICPNGGRCHMISFQTLLQVEGWYSLRYDSLAEPLRRYSATPSVDLPAAFRQAVFNALIGNTDDHLKNFTLLHDSEGWRLSPAYDLLPNTAGSLNHVLAFGTRAGPPDRSALLETARGFSLSDRKGNLIIDEVCDAMRQWREVFADYRVADKDTVRLAPDIAGRLQRVDNHNRHH
ncbi:type II toxin-antitoxin system HipA family toxin [Achromobacter spanius]|uniref:type II toxin-antitoxin system HipA family toxin n=1 Tax=Achromobacter spanius TaxID=217203 RepID=UPI003F68FF98